jgi:hypothetical protein
MDKPAKPNKRTRGHPPFVPTRQERVFVAAMAGLRMSADAICQVIGSARNSDGDATSGKPISKSTLFKHFRNELKNGRSLLKAKVAGKFYAALDEGREWAIGMAMRNLHGFDAGRGGFQIDPGALADGTPEINTFIEFIVPGRREEERPGPVPGQRLLPPPPKMYKYELGNWRMEEK